MKKIYLLILILPFTFCNKKKEVNIEKDISIWIKKTKVKEAIEFEKSINEKIIILEHSISLSKSLFPQVNNFELESPVIIKREKDKKLPIYAEYFFSKNDSIIRFINYDWEIGKYDNYFTKKEIWKKESKNLAKYNIKYNHVKSSLSKKIGKPKTEDSEPKIVKSKFNESEYFSRTTIWETNKIYSSLELVLASNTYRIRWNYYWK